MRDFLWPRSGWKRASIYIWHRIARIPDTSHSIAAGVASGMAVSFTPFLGLHFIMGFGVAWLTRGNMLASAIGTAVGNPWTFPFIFALAAKIGSAILGRDVLSDVPIWSWDALLSAPYDYLASFLPLVFPLMIGGALLGVIVWLLGYFALKGVLDSYKNARAERVKKKSMQEYSQNG
ncbi:DUF2062 domain-containing protein [Kordiimonas sp. SCSIO 12610]|uniref:DUF2062 domain-containing protein n=1 Tax=Kordiimonas sp. SCSIO 12610 TaxID=2829597 RepID=UPI00210AD96B|nr:DUF2062 domain-containing protein [Kordiimonas sp. SCSIO 12610]UTW56668.1 DUF2062 domain-containing protein [Kordiimonas sp. SCSIO 12610]